MSWLTEDTSMATPRAPSYRWENEPQKQHSGRGKGGFKMVPLSSTSHCFPRQQVCFSSSQSRAQGCPSRSSTVARCAEMARHDNAGGPSPSWKNSCPSPTWCSACSGSLGAPLKSLWIIKPSNHYHVGHSSNPAPEVPEPSWLFLPGCLLRVEKAAA